MKKLIMSCVFAGYLQSLFAVPVVSDVEMKQTLPNRTVTITYKLQDAPAVVTLDIETNATDGTWASIGGENIQFVSGAVNRKVTDEDKDENGLCTIKWRADDSWPNHIIGSKGARAVVTAWPLDNTPDYMVVDISASAKPGAARYYTSTNFLPGTVSNPLYKTTSILMRKILAKDVVWTMGTVSELNRKTDGSENAHEAQLTNNYYIGVYEVTQSQWALIQTERPNPSWFQFEGDKAMRPVERVCYNEIRCAANSTTAAADYQGWPSPPYEGSFLDLLRDKTGIDFDLPSDAEWEYACRAGHGEGHWGDGSVISKDQNCPNHIPLERFLGSVGTLPDTTGNDKMNKFDTVTDASVGTAIVGSYRPNSWGLYDMLGNVREFVIDRFSSGETLVNLRGMVYDPGTGNVVGRGSHYENKWTQNNRPSSRYSGGIGGRSYLSGFRVACRAGLK